MLIDGSRDTLFYYILDGSGENNNILNLSFDIYRFLNDWLEYNKRLNINVIKYRTKYI